MTTNTNDPTTVLIAGHWLGAWAWDEVLEHLTAMGRWAIPMTLPGLDETDSERASRTLDDQAAAIERVLASESEPMVIVAHSGANAPVSLVLDRHPELVRRVIWVDSGPVSPGTVFAPDAPDELEEFPLPPFEALKEQASIDGLSADVLERFRLRAVPEPGPVLRQSVELNNDARLKVPTTVVCCSLPSTQLMALAKAGHPMFAEVTNLENLELVDLPTGHWPMWSRPADLAQVLAAAASSVD
ncbi:alpha/beta hydrolase [Rhodococcus spelaei]|uniref:Alpha/beta hydrolase n=1 Tax=Rhodococcus spelaei TaxID=2546320 RepID=A0A541BPF2_9NOCA|nr:alpha/beta hydrolase [Rhodococcus spelaei]TQF74214.1 alpha/beta hydrolase [Rhodococcus spelaei]